MGSMLDETQQSLIAAKAYRGRGDIYRWLRQNYERVLHDIEVLERSWESVAADIAKDGIVGTRGDRPSSQSARKAWRRVIRDVAKAEEAAGVRERERQAEQAKRAAYPSRMSPELRPVRSLPAVRSDQCTLVASSGAGSCETTPIDWESRIKARSPEEQLAKSERKFLWDQRSGWRFGENEREHHALKIEFDLEYREKWYDKHKSYDWKEK